MICVFGWTDSLASNPKSSENPIVTVQLRIREREIERDKERKKGRGWKKETRKERKKMRKKERREKKRKKKTSQFIIRYFSCPIFTSIFQYKMSHGEVRKRQKYKRIKVFVTTMWHQCMWTLNLQQCMTLWVDTKLTTISIVYKQCCANFQF